MAKAMEVKPGTRVKLKDIDANDSGGLDDKEAAGEETAKYCKRIAELQGKLYGENERALLIVLQGMDTAGKDGTIKNVFSGLSPMGCEVYAFVAPSPEERDHDFLWRIYLRLPRKGNIGVFNRSHYEDVLVARVRKLVPDEVWKPRFKHINDFELLASELGTKIVKIFLHIDRDEQRKRLEERLKDPTKNWKYQPSDLDDRKLWDDYQAAYEDVLEKCSTKSAPWHIVPANRKWYRNLLISKLVAETLEGMDPKLPRAAFDPKKIRIPP